MSSAAHRLATDTESEAQRTEIEPRPGRKGADLRIRRSIPALYQLHHRDLGDREITRHEGIPIVTPARAIADGIQAHLGAHRQLPPPASAERSPGSRRRGSSVSRGPRSGDAARRRWALNRDPADEVLAAQLSALLHTNQPLPPLTRTTARVHTPSDASARNPKGVNFQAAERGQFSPGADSAWTRSKLLLMWGISALSSRPPGVPNALDSRRGRMSPRSCSARPDVVPGPASVAGAASRTAPAAGGTVRRVAPPSSARASWRASWIRAFREGSGFCRTGSTGGRVPPAGAAASMVSVQACAPGCARTVLATPLGESRRHCDSQRAST